MLFSDRLRLCTLFNHVVYSSWMNKRNDSYQFDDPTQFDDSIRMAPPWERSTPHTSNQPNWIQSSSWVTASNWIGPSWRVVNRTKTGNGKQQMEQMHVIYIYIYIPSKMHALISTRGEKVSMCHFKKKRKWMCKNNIFKFGGSEPPFRANLLFWYAQSGSKRTSFSGSTVPERSTPAQNNAGPQRSAPPKPYPIMAPWWPVQGAMEPLPNIHKLVNLWIKLYKISKIYKIYKIIDNAIKINIKRWSF